MASSQLLNVMELLQNSPHLTHFITLHDGYRVSVHYKEATVFVLWLACILYIFLQIYFRKVTLVA